MSTPIKEKSNIIVIDGNLIDLSAIVAISKIYDSNHTIKFKIFIIGGKKITIFRFGATPEGRWDSISDKPIYDEKMAEYVETIRKVVGMKERLIARWNHSMLKFEDLTEK